LSLASLAVSVVLAAPTLGQADFPVTGSVAAKAHFEQGLLYLHSFMYDQARAEFRAATALESGFAMGRWGEAMALNHPVWDEQATDEGRAALAGLGDTAHITPLEREWLDAVKLLYQARGSKRERDRAYAAAMDRMHAAHPHDLEVQLFDALAKLGVAAGLADSVRLRMEAGALALDAFARFPDHPGAAHYVIHAFDDPEHAILALPAARRYASIAPGAAHALHMPAHIFVQLGMWPEAVASCQAAVDASEADARAKGEGRWVRENHSGRWLVGLQLEEGRPAAAREELARIAESIPHTAKARSRANYAAAVLGYLLETDRFGEAGALLAPLDAPLLPDAAGKPAAPAAASYGPPSEAYLANDLSLIHGYAALATHDAARAVREAEAIHGRIAGLADPLDQKGFEDSEVILRAAIAREANRPEEAAAGLRKAIELEKALPRPSGPAEGISAWELLGETLLAAHDAEGAGAAFEAALAQHPGRARSLLGAARAAAARGDADTAKADYTRVASVWKNAEPGWPGLAEARVQTE
jgi:tetratricopeptide (TPR) repeat protein